MGKAYAIAPRKIFEPLQTGEYVLTLLAVQERVEDHDSTFSKRGDIKLEFEWEVDVPGGDPETRKERVSIPATFSRKSRFVEIAVALQLVNEQEAIEGGCTVDFDEGLGKRCLGTIVRRLKEDGKEWTDSITAHTVLTRIPRTAPRRPVAPAPAPENEEGIPF